MTQIKGSRELQEDVLKKGLCIDCGACVGLCPYFKSYRGTIGMIATCALAAGRCHAHCPKTEVDLGEITTGLMGKAYDGAPLGHYLSIAKARAGENIRGKGRFQNGGAVSALLALALKTGMIKAAALTGREGLVPTPVLATSEEDVFACATSKYTAAPTIASVNEYGRSGQDKLAVVGTPCQITAVAQAKLDPLKREDFRDPVVLTIGLLCTWAVDTRKFIPLISGRTEIGKVISMDVPPPPAAVMEIHTTDGSFSIPIEEIRNTVPEGCAICPDMTAELTDISVGAMEGDYTWNTLIVRTATGAALVQQAVSQGYLELIDMPAENLANLKQGAAGKKKRAIIKAREGGLLNTDPATGRAALRIEERVVERILAQS
ncbi:MAG: Coenzyme F420 hydrogenase/dehydrogenase, beta subunit C-terminal domain [Pseudomonadota bacterium]